VDIADLLRLAPSELSFGEITKPALNMADFGRFVKPAPNAVKRGIRIGDTFMAIDWNRILRPDLIWVVIPVVAILVGGILAILQQIHRHQERKAMIEQGIHPDYPPEENEGGNSV
jgi:hypothetical protein